MRSNSKLVLSIGLLIACLAISSLPATTTADTIKVPGDYNSIQDAIDAASNNDTIEVEAGTYTERVRVGDKNITIKAVGDAVIKEPNPDETQWDNAISTVRIVNSESTIEGFTIDVDGGWGGIYVPGGPDYSDYGKVQVTIKNNRVINFNRNGITINGEKASGKVEENTVIGEKESGWANNGIQFAYGATGSMKGNTVKKNIWTGEGNWTASGMLGYDTSGLVTTFLNNIVNNQTQLGLSGEKHLVVGNNIQNGDWGVSDYGVDELSIYFNSISGQKNYGVYGSENSKVDATLNWWGDRTGPSGAGEGSGDAVNENVIFSPWINSNPDENPNSEGVQIDSPLTFIVDNVGPEPQKRTIHLPKEVSLELGLSVSGSMIVPGGYIRRALFASNILPGLDKINIRKGAHQITDNGVSLLGPNAGLPGYSESRIGETKIQGPEGPFSTALHVLSNNVTIKGLNIVNSEGETGIKVGEGGNVVKETVIEDNLIEEVNSTENEDGSGDAQGIFVSAAEDVIIRDNEIRNVEAQKQKEAEWGSQTAKGIMLNQNGHNEIVTDVSIVDNYIHDIKAPQGAKEADGILALGSSSNKNVHIKGNTIEGISGGSKGGFGVSLNADGTSANISRNVFKEISNTAVVLWWNPAASWDSMNVNYNSFGEGVPTGVTNIMGEDLDATLNWWGSPDGPGGEAAGSGSGVTHDVIYSPWLGDSLPNRPEAIDTSTSEPGVQLPDSVHIIVDDIGPKPKTENNNEGYLNQAIWGSNQLEGEDVINVRIGSYDATEKITDPVLLQGTEPGAVVDADTGSPVIHVAADNTTVRNLEITSTGHSGEVEGVMVGDHDGFTDLPGESVVIENNLINGINTTSGKAVEGIHAKFYDDGGDQIDGLTIRNNRITDVSEPDSGADGVKLQANLNNVNVTGNTIENISGAWSYGVVTTPSNLEGGVPKNVLVARNVFGNITANTYSSVAVGVDTLGGGFGSYTSGDEVTVRYNDLSGADYGVLNKDTDDSDDVDAILNYWGHATGPYHPTKNSKGKGNEVSDNVIFSPWLRVNPDSDPNKPGVQLGPPMKFGVDDKGPAPVAGYLDKAIGATNQIPGSTIVVNHGTYSPDKQVNQGVEIVSVKGSPVNTHINGEELSIAASNVRIGRREGYTSRGFTVRSDITIDSGVDASKVHINWNNLLGEVTNNGDNTLDAEYNWWGDDNPDDSTFGDVDYNPYLTAPVGEVMDYMEENGIEDPIDAAAGIVMEQASASERAVSRLTGMGFSPGEAEGLIGQYGLGRVMNTIKGATSGRKFTQLLGGYSLPAGAGGGLTNNLVAGGAGSVGGRTVGAVFTKGQSIEVSFPLADFQGNPAKDLTPTVSLVLLNEDGEKKSLEKVTTADYDDESSAYVAVFETAKLQPGYYEVQIDLPDGSSLSQVIKVEGAEA